MLTATYEPTLPIDLRLTLGPLCRGRHDPTMRFAADGFWRATRTPDGPATVHIRPASRAIALQAWGPGAAWALAAAPDLLGAADDIDDFEPLHPLVRRLHRSMPGLRITRSRAVLEALLPIILEQKVTGLEARRGYRALVLAHGEPAPGPTDLVLAPAPKTLAALPYAAMHPLGIERKRAETIRQAGAVAARLERAVDAPAAEARTVLESVPGIGRWSAAEVALVALGDADAVSIGDYHLPHQIAFALAGEARGDDDRMLELLEPFRGHRGRVIRLVGAAHIGPPRRGPRMSTPWWQQRSG